MKPKGKREVEVSQLSKKLPPLTTAQKAYCIKHCFEHKAIKRKKDDTEYICLECGERFHAEAGVKKTTCPHCHTEVEPYRSSREMAKHIMSSFQVLTTIADYQVVRTFYVTQSTIPDEPAEYNMHEVSQVFIQPNHTDIVIALPRRGLTGYIDSYIFDGELEIRKWRTNGYWSLYGNSPYYINADVVYPRVKLLPIIKRNGWNKKLLQFTPAYTINHLLNNPKYETLAKTGRTDIWASFREVEISDYWQQIKMMIRHNYRVKDYDLWRDTIRFAEELGLDTYSPKYVLPADLKAMHDTLEKRIEAVRKRAEKERKRKEMAKKMRYEKKYRKLNGGLLNVVIVAGDIVIKPLQSYKDFCDEGDAMHHCVETYWMKKDSLILSARVNGERMATIELDKSDFHIVQCRAACNDVPKRYSEICDAINRNKRVFQRKSLANLPSTSLATF